MNAPAFSSEEGALIARAVTTARNIQERRTAFAAFDKTADPDATRTRIRGLSDAALTDLYPLIEDFKRMGLPNHAKAIGDAFDLLTAYCDLERDILSVKMNGSSVAQVKDARAAATRAAREKLDIVIELD